MVQTDDPCACGAPRRDYDNRCLRCKKSIDPQRASKLSFDRKISEVPECKCSQTSQATWGSRETEVEGLFYCNFCNARMPGQIDSLTTKQEKQLQEQKKKEEEAYKKRVETEVERIVTEAKKGNRLFLYKSHYMSIDSQNRFGDQVTQLANFNETRVVHAGVRGWRVIESVPRTSGETLENFSGMGKAWAGGIGGSVIGSYILMEFELTAKNADTSRDIIEEAVRKYLV